MLVSDKLKQARADKAAAAAVKAEKAQAIYDAAKAASRAPTAEEVVQFDALMGESCTAATEIQALDGQIAAQLVIEAARRDAPAQRPNAPALADDGMSGTENQGIYRPMAQVRFTERPRNFTGVTIAAAREDAYRAGMWCRAVIYGDARAKQWCNEHGVTMFRDTAQSESASTLGAVLVPNEFEQAIIDLRETYGVFRSWAMPKAMASDTSSRPRRTGGLTAYPMSENAAITESNKTWDNVSLTARKWGVLTRWSNELNDDAVISIADDLSAEIAYAFATSEDDSGFNGDGTSTYNGIVGLRTRFTAALALAGAVDAASGHDTFAEIDGDDLDVVVAKLPEYARSTAKWYTSSVGKALVFDPLLRAAGGNSKVDVAGKMLDQYLGYPIVIAQKLPIVTTDLSDVAMLFFGDMAKAVTFGTRKGISIAVDASRYFEYDQLAIRGTERFDINVHDVGSTTAAGPIVALVGE